MTASPYVQEMIAELAGDIMDGYQLLGATSHNTHPENAAAAARLLARFLLRSGWHRDGELLPQCARGKLLCFDPEPHDVCIP